MSNKVSHSLIIKGAIRGELDSQRKLYMDYYGLCYKTADRYLKTHEQVQEAVNDVFLRIFKNLDQYDTARPFSTWLIRITINHCIDLLRVKKNWNLPEKHIDQNKHTIEPDYSDVIDGLPMLPIIKKLPPQYRAVFNLYVIEEYKHEEIASLLNISISSSKSNLSRAKKIIKSKILNNPLYRHLKSRIL